MVGFPLVVGGVGGAGLWVVGIAASLLRGLGGSVAGDWGRVWVVRWVGGGRGF